MNNVKKDFWTALFLSMFFGMFGVDRFYVGHKILGVLKLITFGGFGFWWIIDIVLFATNNISVVVLKDSNKNIIKIFKLIPVILGIMFIILLILTKFGGTTQENKDIPGTIAETTETKTETKKPETKTIKPETKLDVIKRLVIEQVGEKTNTDKKKVVSIETSLGNNANEEYVYIYLNADDNLTKNFIKNNMKNETFDIIEALYKNKKAMKNTISISVLFNFPLIDKYGNTKDCHVMTIKLNKTTMDKINWNEDGIKYLIDFEKIADTYICANVLN